ncbi:hypothetical protein ACLUX0_07120 [Limosilactobacillus mucosae]
MQKSTPGQFKQIHTAIEVNGINLLQLNPKQLNFGGSADSAFDLHPKHFVFAQQGTFGAPGNVQEVMEALGEYRISFLWR